MPAEQAMDAYFGVVEIAGKRCSTQGCGGDPVAAMPWRTREDGTNVVWACVDHAADLSARGVPIFDVTRTCGMGDKSPCGAAATKLAIIGVRGAGLRLVSVCDRHSERLEGEPSAR